MPKKEELTETKIVKASSTKSTKKDEGASKVTIRAVDKAIIEAQAAKAKKAATPKKPATPKKKTDSVTTEKKAVTKAPIGKALPKATAMGKAMPKNAVPQKKKSETIVEETPVQKTDVVDEVGIEKNTVDLELSKSNDVDSKKETAKQAEPETPVVDYTPEIGIKIISKAGEASKQTVAKPTNIVRREAVSKKESTKDNAKSTTKEKRKPKEYVGKKNTESPEKAPRKKVDVQRSKGDKVVAFTAQPVLNNDKRRKSKDKKDKRDYMDAMPTDLARVKKNKHSKYKEKIEEVDEMEAFEATVEAGSVIIQVPITVAGFCEQIEKTTSEAIMALMKMGIMANINQNLDEETAVLLGMELGVNVAVAKINEEEKEEGLDLAEDRESDLLPRPPVITVMGHVDHGKTSILDAIRSTNVTAGEAGGITQHIGASEVEVNGQRIVFLDTPGHEAFTAMRARGAYITDIAVLVVAADDSVKPQTIESISHAKAANVPIIVAINKMDKPAANPDLVKKDLADNGVLVEDWGGDVICVPVSAKTGDGINKLLEMILLQAEMLELKANPNRLAQGTVIEAKLDKARGPVATLLVTRGTIQAGQAVVAGTASGRIRVMNNWRGEQIKKAGPSRAVEITGLTEVPEAGDEFYAVKDDKTAREIAERRKEKLREEVLAKSSAVSLEKLFSQLEEGDVKELNLIIKADVQGSVGALEQSLEKLRNADAKVNIVHTGVGAINESDVMLASTSNAVIIGFNVRPSAAVQTQADNAKVEIRTYRIIYEIIDDIEAALKGMLNPEFKEVVLGSAEVRDTFKVPNVGVIAGAYVVSGKITRNAKLRLVREGIVIHEGEVGSLKRFKDDAKEVATGFECGIGIDKFNDIKVGDVIEAFEMQEVKQD